MRREDHLADHVVDKVLSGRCVAKVPNWAVAPAEISRACRPEEVLASGRVGVRVVILAPPPRSICDLPADAIKRQLSNRTRLHEIIGGVEVWEILLPVRKDSLGDRNVGMCLNIRLEGSSLLENLFFLVHVPGRGRVSRWWDGRATDLCITLASSGGHSLSV